MQPDVGTVYLDVTGVKIELAVKPDPDAVYKAAQWLMNVWEGMARRPVQLELFPEENQP